MFVDYFDNTGDVIFLWSQMCKACPHCLSVWKWRKGTTRFGATTSFKTRPDLLFGTISCWNQTKKMKLIHKIHHTLMVFQSWSTNQSFGKSFSFGKPLSIPLNDDTTNDILKEYFSIKCLDILKVSNFYRNEYSFEWWHQ